ncbi:hypothetical protein CC80DRAFT_65457 [Byssothecium circinans]|uniref:Uncharacterized protein n=1 Tax=Byssothecium circinans TaxID=147558 RepID=A0A6A5TYS4_9PLEO|nr:hypothetical protein CC80DRAFT_65457 [Byssothecium circinans]
MPPAKVVATCLPSGATAMVCVHSACRQLLRYYPSLSFILMQRNEMLTSYNRLHFLLPSAVTRSPALLSPAIYLRWREARTRQTSHKPTEAASERYPTHEAISSSGDTCRLLLCQVYHAGLHNSAANTD